MAILKIGIIAIISATVALILLLSKNTQQIKEFLMLLSPAYLIVILSVLNRIMARKNIQHSENSNIRKALSRIALWVISGIFVLNISLVFILYVFSRDESFKDWPYGHWQVDNIESIYASRDNIPIQNTEAVKEARRILLPLRPYILESSDAHNISPEAVATFILLNRMLREKYLTHDFHSGLSHLLWNWHVFPDQKSMFDSSPLYRSEAGKWLLLALPNHIQFQDRAVDFLGGIIMGGATTMGNMQIKASSVYGFEKEKSVRSDNLWQRSGIDVSNLSDREISWLLLTNPQLDIEAGVAALRQSIDELSALQAEGIIISSVDLSAIGYEDWFSIFSDITNNLSIDLELSPRPITLHDLTNYFTMKSQDISRLNYVEYFAIVIQSGVFEDHSNAGA